MDQITKLQTLCELIESQQRARLLADGMSQDLLDSGDHYRGSLKMGRKYCNVDFGGSGKYMVDLETEKIFGIKAYGVIHRGHCYGTLDTINQWDWSNYSAVLATVAAEVALPPDLEKMVFIAIAKAEQ
jgi:hypothetical protein